MTETFIMRPRAGNPSYWWRHVRRISREGDERPAASRYLPDHIDNYLIRHGQAEGLCRIEISTEPLAGGRWLYNVLGPMDYVAYDDADSDERLWMCYGGALWLFPRGIPRQFYWRKL